jgi:hypothetical protein
MIANTMKYALTRSFVTAAMLASASGIASAQTADTLCDFLKKAIAATPDEFQSYNRDATADIGGLKHIKGALPSVGTYDCTIFSRTAERGGLEREPNLSCQVGSPVSFATDADFAGPRRVFEQTAAELRACLPNLNFQDRTFGDAAHPQVNFFRAMDADQPDYRVMLQLSIVPTAARPAILLGLTITDHLPPKQ